MSNSRSSEDDALFEDLEACKRSLDTRIYINGKADWPTELGRSLISSLMQIPAVQLKAYRVEVDSMIAFMLSGRSLDEPYTFQSRTTERTYRDRVRKVISSAEEEVRKHEDWSWKWLNTPTDRSYGNLAWESRWLTRFAHHLCQMHEKHTAYVSGLLTDSRQLDSLTDAVKEVLRVWKALQLIFAYSEDDCVAWAELCITLERLKYLRVCKDQPRKLRCTVATDQNGVAYRVTVVEVWHTEVTVVE